MSSVFNIGIDPGVTDTGYVGEKTDTFTLSNTVAFTLSQTGVVSVPGILPISGEIQYPAGILSSQPATITVYDTTSAKTLVPGTDYTLTASGAGSQLTYSILRVTASTNSANNDSCTVSYLYGDMPDTAGAFGETYAQSQVAYTTGNLEYQISGYDGQLPGPADTTGTSVAGIGAALPGGSTADVIPWAGSGQLGGETGTVSQSDYSALQGLLGQDPQLQYGWAPGSPDTEAVYGGGSPLSFSPSLGNEAQGNIGSTADPGIIDTTIALGSLYSAAAGAQNGPAYRNPVVGVAAYVMDTTLTNLMGNQINAAALTDASYYAVDLDTNPWGATGAAGPPGGWAVTPSAPVNLSSQTDAFAAANTTTTYYLSQQGVISTTIVLTDTTTSTVLVSGTDYTLDVVGNGPDTFVSFTLTSGVNFTSGNNVSAAYSYGTPQYFDSVAPASVPGAPQVGSSTLHTDTLTNFTITAQALSHTGIVTPPAAIVVTDTTTGRAGNVGVLNVDYTVTLTGSGSSLAYSVALVATSSKFTSGDTVTVAYHYGNAAYFSYGPSLPVNRGAQVNWGPPSGTTEVDYYLIQVNPTLGTQYVPKTGQPGFYGQPSVAGTDAYGQPVFQSDTITLTDGPLASPTGLAITHGGTAGTTPYGYRIAALNDNGTTLAGTEVTTATGAAALTTTNTNILNWNAVTGAKNYAVYGRTAGAELYMTTVSVTTFTDTGAITPAGALPAANTTQPALSKTGVITPPGQVIVADLTSSAFTIEGASSEDYKNLAATGGMIVPGSGTDFIQADGRVLIYGVDYTITTAGVGPWTTMQINLVPGSVNASPGDTCTVSYWYDLLGDIPLTASAPDSVTLVAGSAALLHSAVITAPQNLIVYDTTISKALTYGTDFTVVTSGLGPTRAMTLSVITSGPAGAGLTDVLHVYYLYGSSLCSFFTQGLYENTPVIYKPDGTTYAWQGYNFSVAAGNRLGLGPWSTVSDWIVPLNYQAPQPGYEGTTETITFRDPANSINPAYKPDGTYLSGTGLGI